jgi:uncharacterized protein (DUF433 family)
MKVGRCSNIRRICAYGGPVQASYPATIKLTHYPNRHRYTPAGGLRIESQIEDNANRGGRMHITVRAEYRMGDAGPIIYRASGSKSSPLLAKFETLQGPNVLGELQAAPLQFLTQSLFLLCARAAVTEDPKILGGIPAIKGTRVPVYDVAASAAAGISLPQLQNAYPSLTRELIELAILYAKAAPPRGRPRQAPPLTAMSPSRKVAWLRRHEASDR